MLFIPYVSSSSSSSTWLFVLVFLLLSRKVDRFHFPDFGATFFLSRGDIPILISFFLFQGHGSPEEDKGHPLGTREPGGRSEKTTAEKGQDVKMNTIPKCIFMWFILCNVSIKIKKLNTVRVVSVEEIRANQIGKTDPANFFAAQCQGLKKSANIIRDTSSSLKGRMDYLLPCLLVKARKVTFTFALLRIIHETETFLWQTRKRAQK